MDAAQLARNISQGKGYTTLFVRPFSIYLVKKHYVSKHGLPPIGQSADTARLSGDHPDLANAPVYPLVLAGLMKVLPFHYAIPAKSTGFWGNEGRFWRYQPDFLIALFNQFLFLALIGLILLLARRLFDSSVAWLSALVLLGTELFWRISISGVPTMLLLLLFTGLVWLLVLLEAEAREPRGGPTRLLVLAFLAGLIAGMGAMTRYSFGWLIVPMLVFLILFGGKRRVPIAGLAVAGFLLVFVPWVARNCVVSGTLFGTAGYAILEGHGAFSGDSLQRSLEPVLSQFTFHSIWIKLMVNMRQIIQSDLPKLGGSWLTAFYLIGLLVNFRNPAIKRLRWFLLMSLFVLCIVQSLGRTQLSDDAAETSSENLLVLVVPVLVIFGVSLFLALLDQIHLPLRELRVVLLVLFGILACSPMILAFLPPKSIPLVYPPYYPPFLQNAASLLKEKELTMSNYPWSMAWYGQRQSVWWTLKCMPDPKEPEAGEDFIAVNDYLKPINLLYIVPPAIEGQALVQSMISRDQSWNYFILVTQLAHGLPSNFPLHYLQPGALPERLVLADWERWRRSAAQ